MTQATLPADDAVDAPRAPSAWMRGPLFDLSLLGFAWVPFYLWVAFGLGLGRAGLGLPLPSPVALREALAIATVAALGCTYVHRHYTFFVVYGDPETLRSRARAFVIAPLAVFGVIAAARLSDLRVSRVSPWMVVLVVMGLWNVWHTLQQRYGILRIYAGKAKGGLEGQPAARRDRAVLWAMTAMVAPALVGLRPELFRGQAAAADTYAALGPLVRTTPGKAALLAVFVLGLAGVAWWIKGELATRMPFAARLPRLSFVASTAALLGVFVVHGPIVGYLCFGVAHSLEYVAFVHHFGAAKFRGREATSPAAVLLSRPLLFAPVLVGGLLAAYWLLRGARATDAYAVYYTGTSALHFLYDGWIWKVRRPEVARPLIAGSTPASGAPTRGG